MGRLIRNQIEQIRLLAGNNKSLNSISRLLELKKSSVYYWFKRYSNHKIKRVNIDEKNVEGIGEFIGIFAGDGNYFFDKNYRYQVRISINAEDVAYIEYLSSFITKLLGKKPWIYSRCKDNVAVFRVISKEVYELIRHYLVWEENKTATVRLSYVQPKNEEFLRGFLKGLIDTDGYLNERVAKFSTISSGLAKDIENALQILGISYKTYLSSDKKNFKKPIYRVVISRDLMKFAGKVNPQHFKYLPSNSIRALVV